MVANRILSLQFLITHPGTANGERAVYVIGWPNEERASAEMMKNVGRITVLLNTIRPISRF